MLAKQIAVSFKVLQQIGVFVGGLISWMQLLDLIDFQELHTQKLFLEKYGYFREPGAGRHSPAEFTAALRDFQRVTHLPPSGVLDAPTLHQMALPRCGTDDGHGRAAGAPPAPRRRRTAQHGGRWPKRHLTYRVVNRPPYLPQHGVRLAVRAAFQLWSNVSSLLFWEAQDGPADIRLTFFHGDHNDGLNNAFDGPGSSVVGICRQPRRGKR